MDLVKIRSREKVEVIDITREVEECRKISEGCMVVYTTHTTAALAINENEENLKNDIVKFYTQLTQGTWAHNSVDNNAEAHLAATALNTSLIIPVKNGKLALGAWQNILFIELDGPRERSIFISELTSENL